MGIEIRELQALVFYDPVPILIHGDTDFSCGRLL